MKRNEQLSFKIPSHGGSRRGAGRKSESKNPESHAKREETKASVPVHINFKLATQVPSLRSPKFMRRFAKILKMAHERGLRVQQYAIESNHVHLICEADNKNDVTAGMMSLKSSIVWTLRHIHLYFGKVFVDRYHAHHLRTPSEMKNALRYVLFNHAKHTQKALFADFYSSVFGFERMHIFADLRIEQRPPWFAEIREQLADAQSWMQRNGWLRAR